MCSKRSYNTLRTYFMDLLYLVALFVYAEDFHSRASMLTTAPVGYFEWS